jgi:5'-methylthioadenosine phosphorylase
MSDKRALAVVGGSGLYALDGLSDMATLAVRTPWGEAPVEIVRGRLSGVELLFLSRHGRGHRTPPDAINYRANIDALKRTGATDIISFSACGSLREEIAPGDFVIVDQFIDRTTRRASSFFGEGFVAHVSMADPACPALVEALAKACAAEAIRHKRGGTYVCIDGPQFSSRAESRLYRSWGADVIGMTNMPEAKLAREAELPYASVAMATDYDCWREREKPVEVEDVLTILKDNAEKARRLLVRLAAILGRERSPSPLGIERVLDFAVITAPEARDPGLVSKLDAVAGRILNRDRQSTGNR